MDGFRSQIKYKTHAQMAQIGLIVILAGIVIIMGMRGFGPREDSIYTTSDPLSEPAVKMVFVGAMVVYAGIMMLSLALLNLALFADNLHYNVRAGLLIAMGFIIGYSVMSGGSITGYLYY